MLLALYQRNADDLTGRTNGLDTAVTNLKDVGSNRDDATHDPLRGVVEYEMTDAHSGKVECSRNFGN